MKRVPILAVATAITALLFAANASAQITKCSEATLVDVRGDSSLSSILTDDGKVTIAEVAVANSALGGNPSGGLTQLVDAVVAAGLVGALDNPDDTLTVFAPVDSAFTAIPADIVGAIVDAGGLPNVLLYHVVEGYADVRNVNRVRSYQSLMGQDIFVKRGRAYPTVNNSEVNCDGILTDNGLVWLIDSVLLPQF